jgi:hypothetical protein
MNTKTAKVLKKYSRKISSSQDINYRIFKKIWKSLSWKEKTKKMKEMKLALKPTT